MKHLKKFNEEKKSEKWIQDAIGKPGSLKKTLGKKRGETISKSEINSELDKLKNKDKDKSTKGVQGLSKADLKKFRRLNLAKTLKKIKESHGDVDNYMFFANLENICTMVTNILEMDQHLIDKMLTEEHDWATDHISAAKEAIEHVHDWLNSENFEDHKSDDFHSEMEDDVDSEEMEFTQDEEEMEKVEERFSTRRYRRRN